MEPYLLAVFSVDLFESRLRLFFLYFPELITEVKKLCQFDHQPVHPSEGKVFFSIYEPKYEN